MTNNLLDINSLKELSPDIFLALKFIDNKLIVVDISKSKTLIFKNTIEEIINTNFFDYFQIEEESKLLKKLKDLNNSSEIISSQGFSTNTKIPIHLRFKKNPLNDTIQCLVIDISLEVKKEKEINLLKKKIKASNIEREFTLEALKIGVWNYNPINKELFWDTSMYQLFEVNEEDFSGHYEAWEKTLHPDSKQKAILELEDCINNIKDFNTEFKIITKSGVIKDIGAMAHIDRDQNGKATYLYGINWDRSKQIEIEQEREKERALMYQSAKLITLGEIAGGLAHEINNPLAIISGFTKVLTKIEDPEKKESISQKIDEATERITKVIASLKRFSRDSSKIEKSNTNLFSLVEEVLIIIKSKMEKKHINIYLEIDKEINLHIDDVQIEQVIMNLIQNSIDAVENVDDPKIKLKVKQEQKVTKIFVIDNGPGIEKNNISKIFDPFFTTKTSGIVIGLGLSTAKAIALDHNGDIKYHREGNETIFELVLPNG